MRFKIREAYSNNQKASPYRKKKLKESFDVSVYYNTSAASRGTEGDTEDDFRDVHFETEEEFCEFVNDLYDLWEDEDEVHSLKDALHVIETYPDITGGDTIVYHVEQDGKELYDWPEIEELKYSVLNADEADFEAPSKNKSPEKEKLKEQFVESISQVLQELQETLENKGQGYLLYPEVVVENASETDLRDSKYPYTEDRRHYLYYTIGCSWHLEPSYFHNIPSIFRSIDPEKIAALKKNVSRYSSEVEKELKAAGFPNLLRIINKYVNNLISGTDISSAEIHSPSLQSKPIELYFHIAFRKTLSDMDESYKGKPNGELQDDKKL